MTDRGGHWEASDAEVDIWEYGNVVKMDGSRDGGRDYVRVELNAAGRVPLRPGVYRDARNRETHPDSPGVLVVSNGLGCGDAYAEFTIEWIERNAENRLTALEASFEQRCTSPTGPALRGSIRFQA
ncbi:hypothetical protein [Amycolatopsis anabasis]|uniref:hypothetical protein n=1 Tax=Amycolatopsis anabasis TaxID=1840409 RepID=UPI00131EA187|nr:hypothetical protein [Amycolatopsis anabasis]